MRVAWSCTPDHRVRRNEVMADVGLDPPDPPLTSEEMQKITYAAKMETLRCLRRRKKPSSAARRKLREIADATDWIANTKPVQELVTFGLVQWDFRRRRFVVTESGKHALARLGAR